MCRQQTTKTRMIKPEPQSESGPERCSIIPGDKRGKPGRRRERRCYQSCKGCCLPHPRPQVARAVGTVTAPCDVDNICCGRLEPLKHHLGRSPWRRFDDLDLRQIVGFRHAQRSTGQWWRSSEDGNCARHHFCDDHSPARQMSCTRMEKPWRHHCTTWISPDNSSCTPRSELGAISRVGVETVVVKSSC